MKKLALVVFAVSSMSLAGDLSGTLDTRPEALRCSYSRVETWRHDAKNKAKRISTTQTGGRFTLTRVDTDFPLLIEAGVGAAWLEIVNRDDERSQMQFGERDVDGSKPHKAVFIHKKRGEPWTVTVATRRDGEMISRYIDAACEPATINGVPDSVAASE